MASGRYHSIATLNATTWFIAGGNYWMAAGAFMGLIITPDLDVDNGTLSDVFVFGINKHIEKAWRAYWWLYRRILPHRGYWSHAPIISTIIRLAYMFWWLYPLGFYLPPAFINGIVAVDMIHWCMDQKMFRKILS